MRFKQSACLLLLVFVALTGMTAGVTAQENNSNESDDGNETATDIDTSSVEHDVSHVTIHSTEWTAEGVTVALTPARDDTIQITERYQDGERFTWETYDVERGETIQITYSFRERPDKLGFSVVSAQEGVNIESPYASLINFDRAAQWSDHYITVGTVVAMIFSMVLYRFKRREFYAKTELRSLLSGNTYRAEGDETTWREKLLRYVYSPRHVLSGALLVMIAEVATGGYFSDQIGPMQTEIQLAIVVGLFAIPLYWWVAGKILELIPLPDQPKMLTLDNREDGGIDVVTGARELFDSMSIDGAKKLREKHVTGTNSMTVYLGHHYDSTTHTVVASWHQILDEIEVAKNFTAAFVNNYLLESEVDEAREIKSGQAAMRQKYQSEAEDRAMQKMDEVHFDGEESTNDMMADALGEIEHDESSNAVGDETTATQTGESGSSEAESGGEVDE